MPEPDFLKTLFPAVELLLKVTIFIRPTLITWEFGLVAETQRV